MTHPDHDPDHPHQPNSPEEILFNDNLREFTMKIGHICGLESNGKIPQEEAYRRIRDLWKALKRSKKNLGIGEGGQLGDGGDGI